MFSYWWPVALIVGSDVLYQICAKKMSSHASPLAALGMTYMVSALACALLFELLGTGSLREALQSVPLPAWLVGVCIAGLEVGTIYMYRAGWPMNIGFMVYTAIIVVMLLFIGSIFYHEPMDMLKLSGVILTSTGMYLIVGGH